MSKLKGLAVLASLWAVLPSRGDDPAKSHADSTPPVISPSIAKAGRTIVWGICGHPTWLDYADWVPAHVVKQIGYVRQLGCTYYRCSFEGAAYPAVLHTLVPTAQAAGITLLPNLPIKVKAAEDERTNYARNYQIGYDWASYAISKKYHLPYWELGNELENCGLVKVIYDGAAPDEYPDKVPGGFAAIASSLSGAYHGIQDAYAAGRDRGETEIVPQMLYGCTFRHWGLLTKILKHNGSLPCDIISWHWYEPNCGVFSAPIHDNKSFSNKRSPAQCLADFKSHSDPGQPMDVWITESNRSVHTRDGFNNGSVAETATGQDGAAQAQVIVSTIEDFKQATNIKGIFVYELLDEPRADGHSPALLRSEGHFGLITGLDGAYKDAFEAYRNEIKESQ